MTAKEKAIYIMDKAKGIKKAAKNMCDEIVGLNALMISFGHDKSKFPDPSYYEEVKKEIDML